MPKRVKAAAVLVAALIGCQSGQMDDDPEAESNDAPVATSAPSELHVEVFYRERVQLPPTATLEYEPSHVGSSGRFVERRRVSESGDGRPTCRSKARCPESPALPAAIG